MDEKPILGEKYEAQIPCGAQTLLASVERRHVGWRASLTDAGENDKELLVGADRFHYDTKEQAMQVIENRLNPSQTDVSERRRLSWARVTPGT